MVCKFCGKRKYVREVCSCAKAKPGTRLTSWMNPISVRYKAVKTQFDDRQVDYTIEFKEGRENLVALVQK